MISYARIGLLAGIFVVGLFLGWRYEHGNLVAYKAEVKAAADQQIAKNESIQKQQALVNKGISDAHEAKLSAIRNYYASGVQHSSIRSMSSISAAPKGTDAETAYPILAGQCAETTLQVNLWQEWATANGLIK